MSDVAGTTTSYTYDVLNRLTQALQKDGGGNTLSTYGYSYDPHSNMTSENRNGTTTTMSYNAADQLTQANSTTYSYDGNGSETGNFAGQSFAYDAANQTTSINGVSMGYRGTGQRERVTNGGNSYQYDLTGLSQLISGGLTTNFTRMPIDHKSTSHFEGDLVSERTSAGTYYYVFDGLGSVVGLTDGSGNLVNQYSYDPYGNATSAVEGTSNPFRYVSTEYDTSSGLYKMGERFYDGTIGRFTQVDPGTTCTSSVRTDNGYAYAGGDPINQIDPEGLKHHKPDKTEAWLLKAIGHAHSAKERARLRKLLQKHKNDHGPGAVGLKHCIQNAAKFGVTIGIGGLVSGLFFPPGAWILGGGGFVGGAATGCADSIWSDLHIHLPWP